MTKITTIGKAELKSLGEQIVAALAEVAERNGVTINYGGGQFGGVESILRLRIAVDDPASQEKAARELWDRFCAMLGLEPQDFGAVFQHGGKSYKVTGIAPSRSTRPIVTEQVDTGKSYLFPDSTKFAIMAARKPATVEMA